MAVQKVSKIEICATNQHKDSILNFLHKEGSFQIIDILNEAPQDKELPKPLKNVEYGLAGVKFCIQYLKNFQEKKAKQTQESLRLSEKEIINIVETIPHQKMVGEVQDLEAMLNEANNKINKLNLEVNKLTSWENINEIIGKKLDSSEIYIGEIKTSQYEKLEQTLTDEKVKAQLEKIGTQSSFTQFVLFYLKTEEDNTRKILANLEAKKAEIPKDVTDIKKSIFEKEKLIASLATEVSEHESKLKDFSKHINELKIVHDYLNWQRAQELAKLSGNETSYTFKITGWLDETKTKTLTKELEKITDEVSIKELELKEDEATPVLLKNREFFTPYEFITHMYGSPRHDEPDPSPFMGIFFIIFFGLCLTDAGYGIILVLTILAAIKVMKLPREEQKFFRTLLWGGVLTTIAGALFGGWFGISLDALPESGIKDLLIGMRVIDPLKDPMQFLIVAFALGILQVLTGIFIGMFWKIKQKKYFEGICDYGFWAGLIISILGFTLANGAIIPVTLAATFKYLSFGFAGGLVLTQGRDKKNIFAKAFSGILSLYGLVGYGSDVLSYSRLLALGLSTAVIAMVVNIMAGIVHEMIPFVGWLFALIIYIGGHIFNLGINALGAYIHSMRLQFVEFFPKFLEGGGQVFSPFKRVSKYVKLKPEN